jgi:hypothetical protein
MADFRGSKGAKHSHTVRFHNVLAGTAPPELYEGKAPPLSLSFGLTRFGKTLRRILQKPPNELRAAQSLIAPAFKNQSSGFALRFVVRGTEAV